MISHLRVPKVDRLGSIEQSIISFQNMRAYSTPNLEGAVEAIITNEDALSSDPDVPDPNQYDAETGGNLSSAIDKWLAGIESDGRLGPVYPLDLARIWTRFTYAGDSISAEMVPTKSRYLGVFFHRAIIAFLHAVAVEGLRSAEVPLDRRIIDNPVTNSSVFADLLNYKASRAVHYPSILESPQLRFFEAIFACPIWGYYLARSDQELGVGAAKRDHSRIVFEAYLDRIGRFGEVADFRVAYRDTTNAPPAVFHGLYHLLNTVHMQSGISAGDQAIGIGTSLLDALSPLANSEESNAIREYHATLGTKPPRKRRTPSTR